MARYIKANPKVTQYLQLEKDRNAVKDGNYLLWQADMLAFGPLVDLPIILEQIGAIALKSHEAREEQDGTVCRPLPVATDPRFVIEPVEKLTPLPERDVEAAPKEPDTIEGPQAESEPVTQDGAEGPESAEQEVKKNPKEKEAKK